MLYRKAYSNHIYIYKTKGENLEGSNNNDEYIKALITLICSVHIEYIYFNNILYSMNILLKILK